jgi:hypothetical protein
MAGQEFATIAPLLPPVEEAVLQAHCKLYAGEGRAWSRPIAYRWLRYEDPMPVERLREAVEKLARRGAEFDAAAVDKACMQAVSEGFSN